MKAHAPSPRLVVKLPVPLALASHGPFEPSLARTFAAAALPAEKPAGEPSPALLAQCRDAWAAGATAGVAGFHGVRALFFDMDSTVIEEESIVVLAAHAGVAEQVAEVTERAMAGELDFVAALRERVALLRDLPDSVFADATARLTPMAGIAELIKESAARGVPAFLVSGGFVQLAGPLAKALGFAGFHANRLGVRGGRLTGQVEGTIVDAQGKLDFVRATLDRLGIAAVEAAAVGDGANDLPMLKAVGTAIGHRPKRVLFEHVHAVNAAGDHRFLLPLLFGC